MIAEIQRIFARMFILALIGATIVGVAIVSVLSAVYDPTHWEP